MAKKALKKIFNKSHALVIINDIKLIFKNIHIFLLQNQVQQNIQAMSQRKMWYLNMTSHVFQIQNQHTLEFSFSTCKNDADKFNHWLEHKGKRFQSKEFLISKVWSIPHNCISFGCWNRNSSVFWWRRKCDIKKKITNEVLSKSKRKWDMFTLAMKPIDGLPSIYLLSKASSDLSWLWHPKLSHLNFKNLNKLVLKDFVRGLPVLKLIMILLV